MSSGLGRVPATDDRHLRRWSLTAETMPIFPTPICIGINWYQGFDTPGQDRRGAWWLPPERSWGSVRGGHEICLKPPQIEDVPGWYAFYDQGNEGACVGFALSRMMGLLNRKRYDAFWLYHEAQRIDEWPGEDYDGTSGRAGCDVLRTVGHRIMRGEASRPPDPRQGIASNRWCTSVQQIAACLDPASGGARVLNDGYVTFLNSWGTSYSHLTRMSLKSLERLVFAEDGDATLVADR